MHFATLSEFLRGRKFDDGSLDRPRNEKPTDGGHYYARGYQFVDNFGADAWLDVWSSKVQSHEMSLSISGLLGVRAMASRRLKQVGRCSPINGDQIKRPC